MKEFGIQPQSAMKLAVRAHKLQKDKGGMPYISHCQRVVDRVKFIGKDYEVVAWLHDVIEDTNFLKIEQPFSVKSRYLYRGELEDKYGLSSRQAWGVVCMTKFPDESWSEYLYRLLQSPVSELVKMADIDDNMSPARLHQLPIETQARLEKKYERNRNFILKHGHL